MTRLDVAAWVLPCVVACSGPNDLPCEDSDGTAVELPRVPLMLEGEEISAEVADSEEERSTAWSGRFCDLDGLLWVPDEVGPAAVTLCGVQIAVDLVFIRDGRVVAVDEDRLPCAGPCDACPSYGQAGPDVDAVLWLGADEMEVSAGDVVGGLDAVALPGAM